MSRIKYFVLIHICFFLFCSVMPYEQKIIPPSDGISILYQLVMPAEPERCLMPPRRKVPEQYRELFAAASASMGIPPGVLEAIACVESSFRARARSPMRDDGHQDLGMFQFNNRYHGWYSDRYNDGILFDPFNPMEAIWIAAQHIQFLYERYGHWPDVFMAYNAGMSRVDNNDIPESTFNYLRKIYTEVN